MIPDINLLPKTDNEEEGSRLIYILLGIIAVILLAVLLWLYFTARSDVKDLTEKQTQLQSQRDQLQQELALLEGENVGTLEQSLEFVEYVSYPVTPIIDETQGLLPEATYLRNYSFSNESTTITVDFETLTTASIYVERLENSPYFSDVQLGAVTTFEIIGGTDIEKEENQTNFTRMPRYTANITMTINNSYLSMGGGNQ